MTVTAMYGATAGILLPNQVQALEFARWFTGAHAHVDLTALNNLKAAVAGGKVATPAQQQLLDIFRQFDASRAQALSLLSSLPVVCAIFLTPTVDMLSDRTRSRLGRRAPWMLVGGIVGPCFLVAVRFVPTVAVLVLLCGMEKSRTKSWNDPRCVATRRRAAIP